MQTTLDLIAKGASVHVVCDAVSSSRAYDRSVAFQRLSASGAVMTTTESAIFELMGSADHPNFKAISSLIKIHNQQTETLCPTDFSV